MAKQKEQSKKAKKKPIARPVKKVDFEIKVLKKVDNKGDKCDSNKEDGKKPSGRGSANYDDSKIKERIAKDKARILEELVETFGIVTNAIAKVKVSNMTFYRWFKEDKDFARAVEEIQDGFDVIVEDKLKQKIVQGDGHSIRFYLSHRVKKYKPKLDVGNDDDEPFEFVIKTVK